MISGTKYQKGLVTCPDSKSSIGFVEYRLDRRYMRFLATVGRALAGSAYGKTHMSYRVVVDGKEAARGPVPLSPESEDVDVSVAGAKLLRLEVDCGDDGHDMDTCAWGSARVIR